MKYNLGSGAHPLEGWANLDRSTGQEIYPLDIPDSSADTIRASHVLEHFSHTEIGNVLHNWVSKLKPGGSLWIAVPNFEWIAKSYLAGEDVPIQGYTMGGQVDENDYHRTIFDEEVLREALETAGLTDIQPWEGDSGDCSSLPVSLNLVGTKPAAINVPTCQPISTKVAAAMSVPRLGFMDNFFCAFQALLPLKIPMRKHTGAFWGQCLERAMDELISEGYEYILTIDYDTIFTRENVETLIRLAQEHPKVDAIASLQASRTKLLPMMTMKDEHGKRIAQVSADTFDSDLTKISTAHFGLTLIKVSSLLEMPKPWFMGVPGENGWDDSKLDDDIYFWRQWENHGKNLFLANRVTVGHAELMIRWPGKDFETVFQHPSEFYADGKPENAWD